MGIEARMAPAMSWPQMYWSPTTIIESLIGTVIVLSHVIPPGETQVVDRSAENHIDAGFGADPFGGYQSVPDFTENLVEVTNPDAPKKFLITKETPRGN